MARSLTTPYLCTVGSLQNHYLMSAWLYIWTQSISNKSDSRSTPARRSWSGLRLSNTVRRRIIMWIIMFRARRPQAAAVSAITLTESIRNCGILSPTSSQLSPKKRANSSRTVRTRNMLFCRTRVAYILVGQMFFDLSVRFSIIIIVR